MNSLEGSPVPTTFVRPTSEGFYAFGNVAPIRLVLRESDLRLTCHFLDEPDITSEYRRLVEPSTPAHLVLADRVAVADLVCCRADMIWSVPPDAWATPRSAHDLEVSRYAALNKLLEKLGFEARG